MRPRALLWPRGAGQSCPALQGCAYEATCLVLLGNDLHAQHQVQGLQWVKNRCWEPKVLPSRVHVGPHLPRLVGVSWRVQVEPDELRHMAIGVRDLEGVSEEAESLAPTFRYRDREVKPHSVAAPQLSRFGPSLEIFLAPCDGTHSRAFDARGRRNDVNVAIDVVLWNGKHIVIVGSLHCSAHTTE